MPAGRATSALTLPRGLVRSHDGRIPLEDVVLRHRRRAHSLQAREHARNRPGCGLSIVDRFPGTQLQPRTILLGPRQTLTGAASSAILRKSLARRSMATLRRATLAPAADAPVLEPVPPDEPSDVAAAAAAGRRTTGASSAMELSLRTGLECPSRPARTGTEPCQCSRIQSCAGT